MSTICKSARYAQPDVLVTTEWLAEHLAEPGHPRRRVERRHAALRVRPHPRRRRTSTGRTDLNDQLRRDYITRDGFEALMSRIGATPRHHRRLLRRQEQLVGLLRLLGVPAVRPHQGEDHGRRPPEVGEGRPRADARDARPSRPPTYKAPERNDAQIRAFRDEVLKVRRGEGAARRRAQPRRIHRQALHMPDYPNEGALRGGHIPGAKSVPWAQGGQPGERHVQDGRRAARSSTSRSRGSTRPSRSIAYCRIGERSSHTWFVLTYLLGFNERAQLRRLLDRVGQLGRTCRSRSRTSAGDVSQSR